MPLRVGVSACRAVGRRMVAYPHYDSTVQHTMGHRHYDSSVQSITMAAGVVKRAQGIRTTARVGLTARSGRTVGRIQAYDIPSQPLMTSSRGRGEGEDLFNESTARSEVGGLQRAQKAEGTGTPGKAEGGAGGGKRPHVEGSFVEGETGAGCEEASVEGDTGAGWAMDSFYDEVEGRGPVLLDVREEARDRVQGAMVIPLCELKSRAFELPPPYEAPVYLLVGGEEEGRQAMDVMTQGGWSCSTRVLPASPPPSPTQHPSPPTPLHLPPSPALSLAHHPLPPAMCPYDHGAYIRPNPFLQFALHTYILPILRSPQATPQTKTSPDKVSSQDAESPEASTPPESLQAFPPSTAYDVLDLGCGSGRDVIYLARTLSHALSAPLPSPSSPLRLRVLGVDNHRGALGRVAALAGRVGLSDIIAPTAVNLRAPASWPLIFGDKGVGLVHGSRFLDRPLLDFVAHHGVRPGGWVVWSTFLEGQHNPAPPYRPSRRLQEGELRDVFSDDKGFEVLHDSLGQLITRGAAVPATFFVARRRTHH